MGSLSLAARIDAAYRAVPEVACKGLCKRACGPISMSAVEADALHDNGINLPVLKHHPTEGDHTCSHLTAAGRCAIYEHRPLICRLFGAVEKLKCPHGCKPASGYLAEIKARALLALIDDGRPPYLVGEELCPPSI